MKWLIGSFLIGLGALAGLYSLVQDLFLSARERA